MNNYDLIKQMQETHKRIMTPAQKRREFKRQQFIAKQIANTTMFVSVFGLSEFVYPVSLNGHRKPVTGFEAMALEATPLPWNIICYALCRDANGNHYIKGMEIHLTEPVKQSAINTSLSRVHYDWMKSNVNMSHILTLAWIATTASPPYEELAFKLFDGLGAFEAFDVAVVESDGIFKLNPVTGNEGVITDGRNANSNIPG